MDCYNPPEPWEMEMLGDYTPCDDCECELCLAGEYEKCWMVK